MGKREKKTNRYTQGENDADRLRRTTASDALGVELVSAFAGDRTMTEDEKAILVSRKKNRGKVFFSDLLYAISHNYFAPQIAAELWNKVLLHKQVMSKALKRNVRITVATLDYLSNVTNELTAPTLISEAYIKEIANLSMRDGMTGLFNHSTCYELLDLEFRRQKRYGIGVSLVLLDIDDFKLVNDHHGHQQGDLILIEVARILREQVRDSDICCDHTTHSPRALIEKADQALYTAKKLGKNKVVIGNSQET